MILVITGGIGSGKTTISKTLKLSLPDFKLINYDTIVRELYDEPTPSFISFTRTLFGTTDRKAISDIVFAPTQSEEMQRKINKFQKYVTGLVRQALTVLLDKHPLVILEYPMFFEDSGNAISGIHTKRQFIISLTCDKDVRRSRVMERDNRSAGVFDIITGKQLDDTVRNALADMVIDTTSAKGVRDNVQTIINDARIESLKHRFYQTFHVGKDVSSKDYSVLWVEVIDHYMPLRWHHNPRHYHNFNHLYSMFNVLDKIVAINHHSTDSPFWHSLQLAIWFHDIEYSTQVPGTEQKSNEESSIKTMYSLLKHYPNTFRDGDMPIRHDSMADLVNASVMIMATQHHSVDIPYLQDKPELKETCKLFLDLDMMILGSDPEAFEQYDQQIRMEWSHVSDIQFKEGRAKFFKNLLDSPQIFNYKDTLFATEEARARKNISQWLENNK